MCEESLRKELEAVYNAQMEALEKKDFDAFAVTLYGPAEVGDELRGQFPELAETFLETMPRLAQTTFVAVKTEGDDLAGYYYILQDPHFANVFLTRFLKAGGRWKIVPDSNSFSFEPKRGEDILAKAKQLIETEAILRLERPEPMEMPSGPRGWNEEVRAALDCWAYSYKVAIAINGAPIGFAGGHSYSGILVGVAPGAEPADPAVLHVGENEITVEWSKTEGPPSSGLTVQIRVLPERDAFRLATTERESGKVTATFAVPAAETDELPLVEINGDETQTQ